MKSNQKKHRSPRMDYYDYSSAGAYFITILIKEKRDFLGKLQYGKSLLNQDGLIAEAIWKNIPKQFPFVKLDEYVFMPNHMHGIVVIKKQVESPNSYDEILANGRAKLDKGRNIIEQKKGGFANEKNPMYYDNLGRVIRWYKGRSKYEIGKQNQSFDWHPRYYEKIIQDTNMLERVRTYIRNNPRQ